VLLSVQSPESSVGPREKPHKAGQVPPSKREVWAVVGAVVVGGQWQW